MAVFPLLGSVLASPVWITPRKFPIRSFQYFDYTTALPLRRPKVSKKTVNIHTFCIAKPAERLIDGTVTLSDQLEPGPELFGTLNKIFTSIIIYIS